MALSAELQQILDRFDDLTLEPTEEEILFFRELKKRIPELRKAAQKAKRGGLDMTEAINSLSQSEARIDKILQEYG
jgi:hypothetical protein